jgi:hypothetical protein
VGTRDSADYQLVAVSKKVALMQLKQAKEFVEILFQEK